ncbi:MAG: Rpn family recombination-promoting nuclease/putative transposase [Stenomitos rutilans HA7619-LM2]|jgi:predicted transposase/invertase (TIGR01784 family)|nr:Rpn family recombination-promoting nuclease/putative transposase [Stenomitos rutilans HA7619-LM2]
MKTDFIFYELFQSTPRVLFELVGMTAPEDGMYSFVSQEVKQTRFQIDGILVPHYRRPELPIYFIEVQGYKQKDTESLYHNFFSEINLYLNDYRPQNDWRGVIIFTERRFDPGLPQHYQDYAKSIRLQRIYLDRMAEETEGRSLEVEAIQLIGVKEQKTAERARALINRARREVTDVSSLAEVIELVNTVCVYKFPDLSREEIETMLGLSDLRQTKVFQEAKAEGAEEERDRLLLLAVPALLEAGFTTEQIASKLKTDVPTINRIIQQQHGQN